jgi:hypothetical protein
MKLLMPLVLEETNTGQVALHPTKKFFKPVLALESPLPKETADVLGCAYLFDQAGNPVQFDGTHKPTLELSGALITFTSKVTGEVAFKTEKVVHFSCWREEKVGMRLGIKVHLPEMDKEKLFELLTFLAQLNKDPYTAKIEDQQGSIIESIAKTTVVDAGPTESEDSHVHKFTIQVGRKQGLVGHVSTLRIEAEGKWISGWECKGPGFADPPAGGRALQADGGIRYESEKDALEAAVEALYWFTKDLEPSEKKEIKAVGDLVEWALEIAPALRTARAIATKEAGAQTAKGRPN